MPADIHKIKADSRVKRGFAPVKRGSVSSRKTEHEPTPRIERVIFLLAGIALLGVGLILRFGMPLGHSFPATTTTQRVSSASGTFAAEPVSIDPKLLAPIRGQEKDTPTRIVIPDVKLDVAVQEAPIVNGYWKVFEDRAGFGLGSAYPQDTGNQVIFAHAREGLFLPLKTVQTGQRIYVMTAKTWYTYRVQEIKEVLPSQKEVIAATADATLTLYTCTGFADSKRLIVVAKRTVE